MSAPRATDAAEVDRLCTEGCARLDARQFAEAESLLLRARALAPRDPHTHYCVGLLCADTGRHAEALAAYEASLSLDDSNAKAHNNRGSALQVLGRLRDAEAAYRRALALRPDLAPPYMNLGNVLEQQQRVAEAIAVYDLALSRGLDAGLFSQYRASALGQSTSRSPDSWVKSTFDNFAPTFDAHLRTLGYDIPEALVALLAPRARGPLAVVDLGCGTGLVGAALAARGHRVVGVDLSEKMLAQARARNAYDALHVAEVHAFLRGAATASFDAAFAADVFIYIGALEEAFVEIARVLRAGGWFAFSTEECEDVDFALLPTGRYAQSDAYVRRLAAANFTVVDAPKVTIRMESGSPIAGRTYLLQRREAAR